MLSYTLSSPIKPDSACTGESDADADWDWDCLDDAMENSLAFIVNPHFAWDEEEGCNGYAEVTQNSLTHETPRLYVQVRPTGNGVTAWKNDGTVKWVWIAYYFNYPIDCQSLDSHTGDTEKIYARLYTTDLKTFYLDSIDYLAHADPPDNRGGDYVKKISDVAKGGSGGVYPWVLSAEDAHASYPGATNDDCGGHSPLDDCLAPGQWTDMRHADDGGSDVRSMFMSITGNIGEPSKSSFFPREQGWFNEKNDMNPDGLLDKVVVAGVDQFQHVQNTGHGDVAEIVSDNPQDNHDDKFCGWKCPSRRSGGDCTSDPDGYDFECATPWKNHLMFDRGSSFPHVPFTR